MPRRSRFTRLVPILLALVAGAAAHAENWPQWRGPRFDGTSAETGLPASWSASENVRWRYENRPWARTMPWLLSPLMPMPRSPAPKAAPTKPPPSKPAPPPSAPRNPSDHRQLAFHKESQKRSVTNYSGTEILLSFAR